MEIFLLAKQRHFTWENERQCCWFDKKSQRNALGFPVLSYISSRADKPSKTQKKTILKI